VDLFEELEGYVGVGDVPTSVNVLANGTSTERESAKQRKRGCYSVEREGKEQMERKKESTAHGSVLGVPERRILEHGDIRSKFLDDFR
jgi:hypothetical protein